MASNLAQLTADRDSLEQAVRSGILQASVDGQAVTFANMKDMRSILNDLNAQICRLVGVAERKPRWGTLTMTRGT